MGRGNTCVHGDYEGLYYADRDYIDCYIAKEPDEDGEFIEKMLGDMSIDDFPKFDYDEALSDLYYNDFISEFISLFRRKFKSFSATGKEYGTIMENELFEIEIEDNEWSYAVKLIQKEQSYYKSGNFEGLQSKHYKNYLDGIKKSLLEIFPSIGCYCGAWTSGRITREDLNVA